MPKGITEWLVSTGDLVKNFAKTVPEILKSDDLTVDIAIKTWKNIDQLIDNIEELEEKLTNIDADESFLNAIEKFLNVLSALQKEMGIKVLKLGGQSAFDRIYSHEDVELMDNGEFFREFNDNESVQFYVGKKDYEIFEVAGIKHRKADVLEFCAASSKDVILEPEPDNAYDKNAIKVIGSWKSFFIRKKKLIGYVPANIAARLMESGVIRSVVPELLQAHIEDDRIRIKIRLIGPQDRYGNYIELVRRDKKTIEENL